MSIQQLKGALPIAVKLLCDRLDVELRYGGDTAKTNGKVVWLPDLPVESHAAEVLSFGYVIHEVGHIRFTDFGIGSRKRDVRGGMENILEDIFIEKSMWSVYAGAKNTLNKLITKLVQMGRMGVKPRNMEPANLLLGFMLKRLRATVLGQSVLEQSAIEAEEALRSVLPDDLVDRMIAKMFTVRLAKSTKDTVQLADELLKMLQDTQQDDQHDQQDQSQQDSQTSDSQESEGEEQQEPGEGDDGAGSESESKEPDSDGSDADAEENNSDGGSGAIATTSDSGSEDEQKTDPSAGNDSPADNAKADQGSLESNGVNKGRATKDQVDAITAILEAEDTDEVTDLGDLVAIELNAVVSKECQLHKAVMPIATVAPSKGGNVDAIVTKTRAATNALRHRISTVIEAQKRCQHYSASSGSRLNLRNAFFAKVGETKVFDRRTDGLEIDTAFMFLLDRSSSMVGMLSLATESSLALMHCLSHVDGVKAAAAAFPAPGQHVGPYGYGEDVVILTSFDERVSATAARYSALMSYGCTPLQNALLWAQYELLKVRASRRILMIATDGQPDDEAGAREILKLGDQVGIETLGLGIKYDVSHLIPDSRKIDSIEEMPHAVFSMMEKKIVGLAA